MIAPSTSGRIWDEATSAEALAMARRFEAGWRDPSAGRRPDPFDFLPERPGAAGSGMLLALLRSDLALRRAAGEPVRIEDYRDRHPEIRDEVLVALIYEEFCLREEAGERPDPAACLERFPAQAEALREVLAIHDLVMASPRPGSTLPRQFEGSDLGFPESGQTIGGFHLVEELGRGSFARVFLARERQLADRPVALKVSRAGSREPQALARLQHTNIVPVHSYRVDSATGLHILCMPYFGRVTLAGLLDDPALREAKGGAALVARLDLLIGAEAAPAGGRDAAREALASRSYPRAVAWWGARMAEGLRHAHDRGVLHRDVKPSNILIAADGTPMLLDFNLARESEHVGESATRLGGTLAYMAPEHLEALIEGRDEGIDHRADLYALGLVLREMLGTGPFGGTAPAESPADLLDIRRLGPPGPIEGAGRVPALASVIRRCLEPRPRDRYDSAADLAADLQAVADDAPLAFAREPLPARASRWLRANLGKLAGVALVSALASAAVVARFRAESAALVGRAEVGALIRDGERSLEAGEPRVAAIQFDRAADRAEALGGLESLRLDAAGRHDRAIEAFEARERAEAFFERADALRFALLGFVGDRAAASAEMVEALKPFGVLTDPDWPRRPASDRLDPRRRARLLDEVDDLLFFWVAAAAIAPPDSAASPAALAERDRNAIAYCDSALRFSRHPAPWLALRRWWAGRTEPAWPAIGPDGGATRDLAAASFRWSLLGKLGASQEWALAWLERTAGLEPGNYWHHFALAFELARSGHPRAARPHYDACIALRPELPWAWKNRALLSQGLGDWGSALDDLGRAAAAARTPADLARVRIELGRARQRLGDFPRARAEYDAVIALDPSRQLARDARRDLARLEADGGRIDRALALYDALLAADPNDRPSREGRANLLLRLGRLPLAEGDLNILIADPSDEVRASALADRADARLGSGRPLEAWADASLSAAIRPTARTARLLDRARLAMGGDLQAWPDSPDAFDDLPHDGPPLRAALRAAADRPDAAKPGSDPRIRRAILLSAALDHASALAEIDRVIADRPRSAEVRLARARIRRRAGLLEPALADVAEGLALEPENAALIELRGLIRVRRGDLARGLTDLAVAFDRGRASARGRDMAEALDGLGRPAEAAEVWTWLVEAEPGDARLRLGLAVARRHLGQWDRSLASLEEASASIGPRSSLAGPVAIAYAACLPARPDRWPRVVAVARRWAEGRLVRPVGSPPRPRLAAVRPTDASSRTGPPGSP